ncbi:hypothetical protein ACHQM5_023172 [Ranunculus cassubicifolius]
MASEVQTQESAPHKRKFRANKSSKIKKKPRHFGGTGDKVKIDKRMKQLFRKRARNYNSDNEESDEEDIEEENVEKQEELMEEDDKETLNNDEYDEDNSEEDIAGSDDEEDAVQSGITKFSDGCRAFKMAFTKITSKSVPDDLLGPVLSGHKKLIAEKLAEEVSERAVKGDAKKEKQLVAEKGHVMPENFLNAHEKFLISVATKGVVKLFNAVNKAQNAQKGLNPGSFKDAKALGKRKKAAFYSELRKKSSDAPPKGSNDEPGWAPLRDSYMLTNSKLKDWDKKPQDQAADDDMGGRDSSSDED